MNDIMEIIEYVVTFINYLSVEHPIVLMLIGAFVFYYIGVFMLHIISDIIEIVIDRHFNKLMS